MGALNLEKLRGKKWLLIVIGVGLLVLALLNMMSKSQSSQVLVLLPDESVLFTAVLNSREEFLMGYFMAGSLNDDQGVLFLHEESGIQEFSRHNLRGPIDLLWMDPNRTIIRIDKNVSPCEGDPCSPLKSEQAVLFMLLSAPGLVKQHSLKIGMSLDFKKYQEAAS